VRTLLSEYVDPHLQVTVVQHSTSGQDIKQELIHLVPVMGTENYY
jgi:hypothetical protein